MIAARRRGCAIFALSFLLASCGIGTSPTSEAAPHDVQAGAAAGQGTSISAKVAAACQRAEEQDGALFHFTTAAEARTAVTGTWLLCSASGLFSEPQAGIELRDSGTYTFLRWNEGGTLEPVAGPQRSWELVDTSLMNGPGSFQVNYQGDRGWILGALRITRSGILFVDNNGVASYTYLKSSAFDGDPALPAGLPPLPSTGIDAARRGCQRSAGNAVTFTTASEARAALQTVWLRCTSAGLFGEPHDGIELRADGEYSMLRWNDAGRLERLAGIRQVGSWEVLDTSVMNGPGTFQVNYHGIAGTIMGALRITDQAMLSINNMGTATYGYVSAGSL